MRFYRALFVATLIAFNMANFTMLFGAFGVYARYLCLMPLGVGTIFYATKEHVRVPQLMLAALYLFFTYAFVTAFWTENVALTLIKWAVYVSLVLTMFVAGLVIPRENDNPLWPMKWVFIPVVLISLVALLRGIGWYAGNFRGYSRNSNELGAIVTLTSPWLIYELRRKWRNDRERLVLLALSGAAALVLMCTYSRAAIAGLFVILTFAGWNLKLGRKFVVGYAILTLLLGIYLYRPATFGIAYKGIVEKRAEAVLSSRSEQMQDSWRAAKQGGWFGVGFGVSVGSSRYWDMESFANFAREKGNSMLAVVEELGILGLVLYLMLVYSVWDSFRRVARATNPEIKFVHCLGLGFYFGALLHSAFEAWFMSSSPDVAVFWGTIGLLLGALTLYSRQTSERFSHLETVVGSRVFVPSPSPRR